MIDNKASLSELRVYDIRYPKESVLRIASPVPISEFIYYDSYCGERYGNNRFVFVNSQFIYFVDNLIGVDNNSSLRRWEFWHSKSNSQYMDGILCLSDYRKLSQNKSQLNSEIPKYLGHSVSQSSCNEEKLFLARLTSDGEMDYCMISKSEKDFPDFEPNEINNNSGDIINFSDFSGTTNILYHYVNYFRRLFI